MVRTSVTQGVQYGLEATKGTLVPATKRFVSTSFDWKAQRDMGIIRPAGRKFATGANMNKKWTELTQKGAVNYNELTPIFLSLVKTVTPVAGTLGDVGSYTWTFAPSTFAPDDYKTFTFERGYPAGSGQRAGYGNCIGLEIASSRSELSLTADWLLRNTIRGFTVTDLASSADLPDTRAFGGDINVYLDTTQGGLGGTQLTDIYMSAWRFQGRRGNAWTMNRANLSWDSAPELAPTAEFDVTVENGTTADTLDAAADSQATMWFRYDVLGPVIVGAAVYRLTIDMPCKVTAVDAETDEQGIDAKPFTLTMVNDATYAKPFQIILINAMATAVTTP